MACRVHQSVIKKPPQVGWKIHEAINVARTLVNPKDIY